MVVCTKPAGSFNTTVACTTILYTRYNMILIIYTFEQKQFGDG